MGWCFSSVCSVGDDGGIGGVDCFNVHLFLLHHVGLPEDLHGIDVPRVHLLHQPHLPEGALSYHLVMVTVLMVMTW